VTLSKSARGKKHYAKYREVLIAKTKAYRAANLEKCRAASREYTSRPEIREQRRLRTYGLTVASYQKLLLSQGGVCAVCCANLTALPKRHVHIDHNHVTKKVRGILCHNCNLGLGHFKDAPYLLVLAASYLRRM
jgi:hypothetical protein